MMQTDIKNILEPEFVTIQLATHISGLHEDQILGLIRHGKLHAYSNIFFLEHDVEVAGIGYELAREECLDKKPMLIRPDSASGIVRLGGIFKTSLESVTATLITWLNSSGEAILKEHPAPARIGTAVFRVARENISVKPPQLRQINDDKVLEEPHYLYAERRLNEGASKESLAKELQKRGANSWQVGKYCYPEKPSIEEQDSVSKRGRRLLKKATAEA